MSGDVRDLDRAGPCSCRPVQSESSHDSTVLQPDAGFDLQSLQDHKGHLERRVCAPHGLGHQWIEPRMAANLLLFARHAALEMVPESSRPGIHPNPTAATNRKTKFRAAEPGPP